MGRWQMKAGGWIAGIQGLRLLSDGRFPGGFSRNTWVMLPIPRLRRPRRSYRSMSYTWGKRELYWPNAVC